MTKKDQNITPAGQVELNEEELDQVTGGKAAFSGKIDYLKKGYKIGSNDGKTGEITNKKVSPDTIDP